MGKIIDINFYTILERDLTLFPRYTEIKLWGVFLTKSKWFVIVIQHEELQSLQN